MLQGACTGDAKQFASCFTEAKKDVGREIVHEETS